MAVKFTLAVESKSKQPGHQVFIFGEGDHAVSNVTGGNDIQLFPQSPGAAAVVCHGHDNGNVRGTILQTSKKSRQASASSYGENSGAR